MRGAVALMPVFVPVQVPLLYMEENLCDYRFEIRPLYPSCFFTGFFYEAVEPTSATVEGGKISKSQ